MGANKKQCKFILLLTAIYILHLPIASFSQARDTTVIRPSGSVSIQEFKQSIADDSRIIYLKSTSDSLMGPIRGYSASKFYLEDSSVVERNMVRTITEHWTYSNRGVLYGALGGIAIGIITSAVILIREGSNDKTDGSQAFVGTAFLLSGTLMLSLPGLIVGAIVGSWYERGYNFPISALEQ